MLTLFVYSVGRVLLRVCVKPSLRNPVNKPICEYASLAAISPLLQEIN